jgi:hypothetical protein
MHCYLASDCIIRFNTDPSVPTVASRLGVPLTVVDISGGITPSANNISITPAGRTANGRPTRGPAPPERLDTTQPTPRFASQSSGGSRGAYARGISRVGAWGWGCLRARG